jgi:MraZ protein
VEYVGDHTPTGAREQRDREEAAVYLGEFSPRLDEKGRLILPAKYRSRFSSGVYLVKGQEHCVEIRDPESFEAKAAEVTRQAQTHATARAYSRVFFSSAYDETPDKQGRVGVSPALREYAGLDRDVIVVGVGDRLEMWAPDAWTEYRDRQEADFAALDGEVVPAPPA